MKFSATSALKLSLIQSYSHTMSEDLLYDLFQYDSHDMSEELDTWYNDLQLVMTILQNAYASFILSFKVVLLQ